MSAAKERDNKIRALFRSETDRINKICDTHNDSNTLVDNQIKIANLEDTELPGAMEKFKSHMDTQAFDMSAMLDKLLEEDIDGVLNEIGKINDTSITEIMNELGEKVSTEIPLKTLVLVFIILVLICTTLGLSYDIGSIYTASSKLASSIKELGMAEGDLKELYSRIGNITIDGTGSSIVKRSIQTSILMGGLKSIGVLSVGALSIWCGKIPLSDVIDMIKPYLNK